MKNKIVGLLVSVFTLIFTSLVAYASYESVPPIWGQDILRTASLQNVVRGTRSVYAQSINWSYGVTYTNVSGVNAEDVLEKLFAAELIYQLANPSDKIQGYLYLYDKNNRLLFSGYTEFTSDSLKDGKPFYQVWMQQAPILSDAESAEVLVLDTDGKTVRHIPLTIDQYGQVLFDPYLAGSPNGILAVKNKNGDLLTYSLAEPIRTTPGVNADEGASCKIDGHYIYKNITNRIDMKIVEMWNRPTVYIETEESRYVDIDVSGLVQENGKTFFEKPTSIVYIFDDGQGYIYSNLNPTGVTTIIVPKGKYRFYFQWEKFGKPGMIYTGPVSEPQG